MQNDECRMQNVGSGPSAFCLLHSALRLESAAMKRSVLLFLALAIACSRSESPTPATAQQPQPPMKVGLLTPGSVNDNGWNAIAYEGLQRIHNEVGAEISHQQTKTPAEFEEGFRSYGAKGFNLAFGHGFEFQDA